MKSIAIIFALISNMAFANCQSSCNTLTAHATRLDKIERLLKKNQAFYQKYKNDISKKIKISSNILILNTKKETFLIEYNSLKDQHIAKGCTQC